MTCCRLYGIALGGDDDGDDVTSVMTSSITSVMTSSIMSL